MQSLVFNSTVKTVKLFEGTPGESTQICSFENIPTVKVVDNFYEVMQKDELDKTYPILRVPIANTNMYIKR